MDQKFAKKLGEVLAFERATKDLFEKGAEGLSQVLSPEVMGQALRSSESRASQLEEWATGADIAETVLAKAEATGSKLTSMRDMYVQDRWDDGVELMEWLGFFEGAAIVHWELVRGGAQSFELETIEGLANDALKFHEKLLNGVREKISTLFKK